MENKFKLRMVKMKAEQNAEVNFSKTEKTGKKSCTSKSNQIANSSGIKLKPFYMPEDRQEKVAEEPGKYPFTRGLFATGYRTRLWTMRQYAGFGTAEDSNKRFRYLLTQGQTGLSVAFDLPTQMGYDSDYSLSEGETGKVGVAIDSLKDMEILFDNIPLDQVTTSMTINAPAAVLLAMYIAVAEKQGVDPEKLEGTIQNDILKEYVARGTYIYPPRPSVRLAADTIVFCAEKVPKWNTISVSGYHMRDAGANTIQEMAFSIANAITYVDTVLERGLDIDAFARRISWIFNTHNDFFLEIAKYRALRRIWARLMKERYGARDDRSCMLRTHTQTGGSTLTAQQPENNIIRAAYQALAAALGGVQSLALSCYDEALSIPTEFAQQIALRTQEVLAYEDGITSVTDPLGGSYYIEKLTDKLEEEVNKELTSIEKMGGAIVAVESGYFQKQIQESSYQYQLEEEDGKRVIVGVNRFEETVQGGLGSSKIETFQVDTKMVRKEQLKRLAELKENRDSDAVELSLLNLKTASQNPKENLVPVIMSAVKAYATLGEICDVLRKTWGVFEEKGVF
jgi:methylmalonyl-CoA mutase, N-terminal domain